MEIGGKVYYTGGEVIRVIFRKDVDPACCYCRHASPAEEGSCICLKRGIVSLWDSCRRFSYDPLKRVPEQTPRPPEGDLEAEELRL